MSVMEKFRNYRKMVAMMLYRIIYVRIMMRLNVIIHVSMIMIFVLPETKKYY